MKRLALYVVFILCFGLALSGLKTERKCLWNKVITFPKIKTGENWAKLQPNASISESAITVCLRFYTEKQIDQMGLFSLATASQPHFSLVLWSDNYNMTIYNNTVLLGGLPTLYYRWNSVCVTWNAKSGLAQMFVNNFASTKIAMGPEKPFKGKPDVMLGQFKIDEEDYRPSTADFYGFISDVNVHKKILTATQIKRYMSGLYYQFGDYISWYNVKYTIAGAALVEEKQQVTF